MKSLCEQYEIRFRKCFFKIEDLRYDSNEHLVSFGGNYDFILLSLSFLFNASFVLRVLYFYVL